MSRKSSTALVLVAASLVLVGCSSAEVAAPAAISDEPLLETSAAVPFTVELDPRIDVTDGKITISITTNLPDGAELGASVQGDNFFGQDKETVLGGKATFFTFSHKGEPLASGKYEVHVGMSYPRYQSQAVQNAVGAHGELMEGPLVVTDDSGDRRIALDQFVVIGSDDGAKAAANISVIQEAEYLESLDPYRNLYPGAQNDVLLDAGKAWCTELDGGADILELLDVAMGHLSKEAAMTMAEMAIHALCPRHKAEIVSMAMG
jgi:hypothetical protein